MDASLPRRLPPEWLSPEDADKAAAFIRGNLPLTDVSGTGIRLHLAGPRSGLARLVPPGGTPYWAYAWPGGVALALHLAAHPDIVRGRAVFEIGSGSGLVSLAALRVGAAGAMATEADPLAAVASQVNAEANGLPAPFVHVSEPNWLAAGLGGLRQTQGPSVVVAGDVFYDEAVAASAAVALDAAWGALGPKTEVLVGDIGRRFLPRDRLAPLASYPVRDLGDPPGAPLREGWVFRWNPQSER